MTRTDPGSPDPGTADTPEGERLELLRTVVDTSFEPSLLVRVDVENAGEGGSGGALSVLAANIAAADLLVPGPGERRLQGRLLVDLMPWAGASGLLEAFDEVVATGVPLRIHDHEYEEPDVPGGRPRPRLTSVGALKIAPDLMLVTLRPKPGAFGADPAWEEKVYRLAGTGPWEWDVRTDSVHWYAQALAVLGSSEAAGLFPAQEPPYQLHHEDVAEFEAFLRSLVTEARPGHVEVRVLQRNGAARHIRFGGDPVPAEGGEVVRVYGTVQDVTVRRRAQTALEIAQVQLAARRTRAESERQLAGLLQQVIMPTGPVPDDVPGVEVVARYRPASAAAGVGGDWYGVARLDDGRVLMHIGDVAGHGFPAATAMARLYHALQGLAVTGADAAQLLHWLNCLTCNLSEFTLATACCAIYDPRRRRLSLANAGHPSPVFVREGKAQALTEPASGMLGIDTEMDYEERELEMAPGDVLLFYTDGLIERRRRAPDENTAALLLFASAPVGEFEKYVDDIMGNVRSDTDDDACLVAVRFL